MKEGKKKKKGGGRGVKEEEYEYHKKDEEPNLGPSNRHLMVGLFCFPFENKLMNERERKGKERKEKKRKKKKNHFLAGLSITTVLISISIHYSKERECE